MIREARLNDIRRELMHFKRDYLVPLYGSGPLGAQIVYAHNKCMTTYSICDSPSDIQRNLKRFNRLFDMIESEQEREVLDNLYSLYMRFVRVFNNNSLSELDNKLSNINRIFNELQRYNTFKDNQNVFDNYISLLKIQDRLSIQYNLQLDFKPKFITDETTSDELEKEFKREIEKQFKNLVFLYNISNEYNKIISEELDIEELLM